MLSTTKYRTFSIPILSIRENMEHLLQYGFTLPINEHIGALVTKCDKLRYETCLFNFTIS